MNLTIHQSALKAGLAAVSKAVAGKSTLPILANVLLNATADDAVTLTATNLEHAISVRIACRVEVAGATTLPHKLLADVVGTLSGDVSLETDAKDRTRVKAGKSATNIHGIDSEEFPVVPHVVGSAYPLAGAALAAAIRRVAFAVASDDSRPVLAGVLLQFGESGIMLAAADGFRLNVETLSMDTMPALSLIVPGRVLWSSADAIAKADAVRLTSNGDQLRIEAGDVTITTRLLEGTFPDVARIIPAVSDESTRVTLAAANLLAAIRQAALFAQHAQNVLRLVPEPEALRILANAAEVGDADAVTPAVVFGTEPISLNCAMLAEGIEALRTERVTLEWHGSTSPATIRAEGWNGVGVIMPMSIKNGT
jgi:DNA polymerase-3 subunit beta